MTAKTYLLITIALLAIVSGCVPTGAILPGESASPASHAASSELAGATGSVPSLWIDPSAGTRIVEAGEPIVIEISNCTGEATLSRKVTEAPPELLASLS